VVDHARQLNVLAAILLAGRREELARRVTRAAVPR